MIMVMPMAVSVIIATCLMMHYRIHYGAALLTGVRKGGLSKPVGCVVNQCFLVVRTGKMLEPHQVVGRRCEQEINLLSLDGQL